MRYTILFCLCFLAYGLLAQNTPSDRSFAAGIAAYNGGQYEKAVKHFLTARLVNGWIENEKKKAELDSWTAKCYNAIRAEAALQMAVQLDRPHAYDYVIKSFPNTPQAQAATNRAYPPPPKPGDTDTVNGVIFTMVPIKGGTFLMGCTDEQQECGDDEKPAHSVTLSDYAMGETEVTQALWNAVMNEEARRFQKCDQCPVEGVGWEGAQTFIAKLNKMTTRKYRLPTEAEWEYAAREGGKAVLFGNGKNVADPAQMNFDASAADKSAYSVVGEYRAKTTPVKTFYPNALGLYDMAGNVWEWCEDWYASDYYTNSPKDNPRNDNPGKERVRRGGDFTNGPHNCRVATRRLGTSPGSSPSWILINTGFRLASQ